MIASRGVSDYTTSLAVPDGDPQDGKGDAHSRSQRHISASHKAKCSNEYTTLFGKGHPLFGVIPFLILPVLVESTPPFGLNAWATRAAWVRNRFFPVPTLRVFPIAAKSAAPPFCRLQSGFAFAPPIPDFA